MGKRGPEPTQINWEEFDKLVSYQCTQIEVAAFFDISVDTLERACEAQRGVKLADIWDKRKLTGKVRLRKIQFAIAEGKGAGAATMAIYLDKKMFPEETPRDPPPGFQASMANALAQPVQKKTFVQFCIDAGYPAPFTAQVGMYEFAFFGHEPRLLLGARGYGKTDYVTILGTAYDVYCAWFDQTETSNLIISKSKTRNASMIEEIANALMLNGVALSKKNSSVIRVQGHKGKDHSVEAITIKSSFRGRHPVRILMDDPVTEEDTSEAMRILVKKKYDEAYKLSKNLVIIGQPAHAFDLYAELRPTLKKLEVPHGSIPELDADLALMKLAGVDENSIEMSYHLKIPTKGASIFANLNFTDHFPDGPTVAFIDPSDGGDYTAVTVARGYMAGVAVKGKAWKRAWYHCLDELVAFLVEAKVVAVRFETNKHGNQPVEQLQAVLGPLGIGVEGHASVTTKVSVIEAAGSYAHLIHLSKQSDRVYTDQVVRYEYSSKHDDAPDSLARCLEWMRLIRGKTR